MEDVLGAPEIITLPPRKRVRPRLTTAQKEAGFTVPDLYELRDDVWQPKEHPPERLKARHLLSPSGLDTSVAKRLLGTWKGDVSVKATPIVAGRAHVPAGPEGLRLYQLAVTGYGSPSVKRLIKDRRWRTDTPAEKKAAAIALREEMQGRPVPKEVLRDQQSPLVEKDVLNRARLAVGRGILEDMSAERDENVTNSVVLHLSSSATSSSSSSADDAVQKRERAKEVRRAFIDTARTAKDTVSVDEAKVDQDGLTAAEKRLLHKSRKDSDAALRQSMGKSRADEIRRLRMQQHAATSKRLRSGEWDARAADIANYNNAVYDYAPIVPAPHQMAQMQSQVDEWWGDSGGSDLSMEQGNERSSSHEIGTDLRVGRRRPPVKRALELALSAFSAKRAARR